MKHLVILGSTGSIGTQTLEICEKYPDRFSVAGLTAHSNWQLLAAQAKKFHPEKIAIGHACYEPRLREALEGEPVEVLAGPEGINEIAALSNADTAVVALVGISGLVPTLKAIEAGKTIALANKETLVVGGELVMQKAKEKKRRHPPH